MELLLGFDLPFPVQFPKALRQAFLLSQALQAETAAQTAVAPGSNRQYHRQYLVLGLPFTHNTDGNAIRLAVKLSK